jgi:hypothetical protein
MKRSRIARLSSLLAVVATLAVGGICYADQAQPPAAEQDLKETMPVLRGEQWQKLEQDAKIAFVWGIGHVVTVEEHVVQRHPELKREDFVAKLAEGLRGVPMKTIVDTVDNFYRSNPGALDVPVMRVIWRQLVKPKLSSGVAGRPLQEND